MRIAGASRLPIVAITCVLVGGLFAWLPEAAIAPLALDRRRVIAGEIWRLWSAHLVHFSSRHASTDLCALFVLAIHVEAEWGSRTCASILLCAAPVLSLILLLAVPDLAQYRGASGLCVMLAAISGLALWRRQRKARGILTLLGCAFAFKTLLEGMGIAPNISGLASGIAVVWQAHVFGAAIGVLGFFLQHHASRFNPICHCAPIN
jgi:rhomboid family GlyGly-CTERM serine protease